MLQWRVYYTHDTFSNLDGTAYDAPPIGVQVIAYRQPDIGTYILAKCDFYWWDIARSQWFGGDQSGFYQYLFGKGPRKVLFGATVTNAEYEACVKRALEDPDFPEKTARLHGEDF
jgi:hypothetical protein